MKKSIATLALVSIILTLTACGQSGSQSTEHAASTDLPESAVSPVEPSAPEEGSSAAFCGLDVSLFSGGVERFFCAGNGRLLVYADALYLYDTRTGTVFAQHSFDGIRLSQIACTPLTDGFAVIGWPAGETVSTGLAASDATQTGATCYLFDSSLNLTTAFSLDALLPSQGSVIAAQVSPDGAHIAVSTVSSLYLCSIADGSVQTIMENTLSKGIGVIEALTFTEQGSRIAFLGEACGSVALDGSDFVYESAQGYDLGDSMIGYDASLWFPQDFTKASGQLLMTDGFCRDTTVVSLTTGDTGRDGVYGSEQGRYLAAVALLQTGIRVNIYDAVTMELITTKEFSDADSSYFARAPRSLCIMDDARAGTLLCGYDRHTIAFDFSF